MAREKFNKTQTMQEKLLDYRQKDNKRGSVPIFIISIIRESGNQTYMPLPTYAHIMQAEKTNRDIKRSDFHVSLHISFTLFENGVKTEKRKTL